MNNILYFISDIHRSKSKSFLAVCFCILGGTALGGLISRPIDFVWLYALFLGAIFGAWLFCGARRFVFLLLAASILGCANYHLALRLPVFEEGKQMITGVVASEPDIRTDGVRYIVATGSLGRVYLKAPLHPQYRYGDELSIECTLSRPGAIDGFRFDMFLRVKRVFVLCAQPSIVKVSEGKGTLVYTAILRFKQLVAGQVSRLWHEPYAGFVGGLLYGYRGGLGSLDEAFARTGLTHIVAISGYNIAIIATILMMIAVRCWLRRQQAFYIVIIGIVLFVIFTGASASVVRAGIMGSLVLVATQLGRVGAAARLAVLAATLMVLVNPFVLLWDVGFQLSFVATLGIIYLTPVLSRALKALRYPILIETAAATFAAIITTTPLSLYHFESFSLIAPIANLLVLPLIPYIMSSAVIVLMVSFFSLTVAVWLGGISLLFMWIVTKLVRMLSALPFAAVHISFPLLGVVLYYGILIVLYRCFRLRVKHL